MVASRTSQQRNARGALGRTAAALLATVLLASCSESPLEAGDGGPDGDGGGSLTVGLGQNPDTLDPSATGLIGASQVNQQIFDTLIWRFPDDDQWYPGLAEDMTISEDGTVYTFTLRDDVTFHDGTPFNAEAVQATFEHIVDPATQSKSAIGALGPYQETRVVDEHTAEIVFSEPNLAFQNYVSEAIFGISSPTAIQEYGADYGSNPVGTGPFVFESFQSGESVELTRNEDYAWGPDQLGEGPADVSALTFRILTDPSAQANSLATGEIDVAQNLTPQDAASAIQSGKAMRSAPARGIPYGFLLNVDQAPTNELAVRQALILGFDRQSVLDTLFEGQYDVASSVLTPTSVGYDQDQGLYEHDPDRATQLLDEAGWVKGSDGMRSKNGQPLTIETINISGFGFSGIAQLFQAQMKDLGVTVSISDQAFPAVATTYNQGMANTADWFFYAVDPFSLKTVFGCDQIESGFNWAHYCNADLDAAVVEANGIVDDEQRDEAYAAIARTLMEDATFMPIRDLKTLMVTDDSVGELAFTVSGQPLFASTGGE